ncbi:MAG: cysteine desulfurase [Gammaproteobacteria bacterium]|nr:cysteine desulfurase [Gammaproteobacteria bacterium]MDH5694229.1 cysteine desulfurase [Gammaproteobacteria bacterium]
MTYVYLDYNASTPVDQRVLDAMLPFHCQFYGNPSSISLMGRQARAGIDQARQQVAALVSVHPSQVLFTSGGTEANNLAIKGAAMAQGLKRVAWSAVEHPSILRQSAMLSRLGTQCSEIPVDSTGRVNQGEFKRYLESVKPQLVSVMTANNETGVIQDIAELTALKRDVIFHTDAVQAAGKIQLKFEAMGVDLMTLSSHKIYGPKGVGALIFNKSIDLEPLINGGGHEGGLRAGTENVAGIVGFGAAAELAKAELQDRQDKLSALRKSLEDGIKKIPGVHLFAQEVPRLANTCYFGIEGIEGEAMVLRLDQQGFGITSGSACSSKSGKPSNTLLKMGVEESLAATAIRVSVGKETKKQDIDEFIAELTQQAGQFHSIILGN